MTLKKKSKIYQKDLERPNIGAAAMLATTANEEDPFWSQIYKAIDAARGGEEVQFLLSVQFLEEQVHLNLILQEELIKLKKKKI